jgi:excisionase family DNA binding protein
MNRQKTNNGLNRQPMMTVNEVSDYLSLSTRSVYRLLGDLPAIRVGGRWRFRTSDIEQWLLKQRTASEPQIEPVEQIGSKLRLFSHMAKENVLLDVPLKDAASLIRHAVENARLDLVDGPEREAREQIYESILERENLCSTALHRDVAFPHPRDPEKCPLASDQIVVVRATRPVEFHEINGYRPRLAFVLLARTASLQLLWEARLSHLLHREGFVQKLLAARAPDDLYELFLPPDRRHSGPEPSPSRVEIQTR